MTSFIRMTTSWHATLEGNAVRGSFDTIRSSVYAAPANLPYLRKYFSSVSGLTWAGSPPLFLMMPRQIRR